MEILRKPAWWVPCLLGLLHQVGQYGLGLQLEFIDAYLDPLLCLPVLLGVWLVDRKVLFQHDCLNGLEVILAGLALSILFEEGFPRWQSAFVRDNWDYPAYAVGGAWFWWQINPKPKHPW